MTTATTTNPELIAFLKDATKWSNFAKSLVHYYSEKGYLTPKQEQAAMNMMNKVKSRDAAGKINLVEIKALFDTAKEAGINRRALRGNGLKLTEASERSRNPGAIYVKGTDGTYYGKITKDGEYFPTADAPEGILEELQKIADDPLEYMREYGQKTGECACCGRELTNPDSIALGIGPICAEHWGLI